MYMDTQDDQKDLFQEILYNLWKSYGSFKKQSSFSTWMYRVALNTAILYLKKDKSKLHDNEFPENIPQEPDSSAQKELQLYHFYKAVKQLDKIEKAIVFYALENYSHKEIAVNLGISEGNARVKLLRAKEKMKTIVKKQGYEF